MTRAVWQNLLDQTKAAFEQHPDLSGFCAFPDDLRNQEVVPYTAPCASYLARETGLFSPHHARLRDAFVRAGPHAHWRETYKGTAIGQDFMDRFGCYCLIGDGGAFISTTMWAFVVYMPPRLSYPFHHHPAEELYFVIAGEAEFMREGEPNEVLRAGATSMHQSNQPHAMQTYEHPVMCMVLWRNGFETLPVLT